VKLATVGRHHVDRYRLRKNAGHIGPVNVSVKTNQIVVLKTRYLSKIHL
jgi:hypothetical protein